MKNLLIAAGLTAFAIGACNTTTSRSGMSKNDDMNKRDQTTTSTADRNNMPAGSTTTPSTSTTRTPGSTTRPQSTATPSADGSSTTTAPGENNRTDMDRTGTTGTMPQGSSMDPNMSGTSGTTGTMPQGSSADRNMSGADSNTSGMDMKDKTTTEMNSAKSDRPVGYDKDDMTDPKGVVDAVGQYGGLTNLPKDMAMKVVDGYITKLSGMPNTSSLVSDLNIVKAQLGMTSIDNKKMGEALQRLGTKTTSMAGGDSSYKMLGQALESSGSKLAGM